MLVYTSGPIDFATETQITGWRQDAEKILSESRVLCVHPIKRDPQDFTTIVEEDMEMMARADAVLAWTPPIEEVSRMIGTPVEIYHCSMVRKIPVFSWGCKEEDLSPWIRYFISGHSTTMVGAIDLLHDRFSVER